VRVLLQLYPRRWRERYGEEFELVLRTSPPGVRTVLDVVRGALDAHVRTIRPVSLLSWALLVVAAVVVGWLDVHATDDVQPVAAALLVFGFAFGFWRHSPALLVALVLFAAVPLGEMWAHQLRVAPPHPLYESLVALIPALLGSLTGSGIRRLARG
jgi:hypothetical protein